MSATSRETEKSGQTRMVLGTRWIQLRGIRGQIMRGSRKFCQRVPNFFFSLMRGGRIQIPLLAGLHRRASAFRWRADDGPTLSAGLVAL